MYLLIQNSGVAPVEAFTILGVSTARANEALIGQFGTGGKNAINILLRFGLNPQIFLGDKQLQFYTKPKFMGDKQYNLVCYSYGDEKKETGFSLEFGELDWNSLDMALREIISNAIDAVGVENVVLDIVNEVKPYSDSTSVYIPLTPDVQKYYNQLSKKFLHFVKKDKDSILEKNEKTQANIYRKGVFVRQIDAKRTVSLFDYNFDGTVKIDDARNMDDYTCQTAAGKLLGKNKEALKKYFKTLTEKMDLWEDNFCSYHFDFKLAKEVWKEVYGDALSCELDSIKQLVEAKGRKVVMTRNHHLLKTIGIPCAEDEVGKVEQSGYVIKAATSTTVKNFNEVWRKLETFGLTNGKVKPECKSFTGVCQNGSTLRGYYDKGCIYINVDDEGSMQTILEECSHYITNANDGTREFTEFAFNVACRLAWN